MEHFRKLGLSTDLLEAIKQLGFEKPTEIQEKTIPLVLAGRDLIAGSATGSGKTLAFGAPMIQNIHKKGGIQGLILTPTRELAEQIYTVLRSVTKLGITAVYGGVAINPQFKDLTRSEIVVATPGRLLDHLERGTIDLSFIKYVVLDEADRMLDMGFLEDVNKIISQCPKEKQMLLFSATIPPEVAKLSKKFMNNPEHVKVSTYVDASKMEQSYYDVTSNLKFSLLVHLLKKEEGGLVMVFCNSRRFVDVVSKNLNKLGIDAMGIHGGLSQAQRTKVLAKFNSKDKFVLVCTDVAARGLDIPDVSHVYNYDIPLDAKQYIHRIGRTARAGKSGKIINLLSQRDYDAFSGVLRDNDFKITKEPKPFIEEIKVSADREERGNSRNSPRGPPRNGGRGGSRNPHGGGDRDERPPMHRRTSEHSRGSSAPTRAHKSSGEGRTSAPRSHRT